MNINKLTPDFEKIDTTFFKNYKSELTSLEKKNNNIKIKNNVKSYFNKDSRGMNYTEYDSNNNLLKEIIESEDQFTVREFPAPTIEIYKEFYKNGNIKTKGMGSVLGFNIGKSYHYDDKGKLVEEKDHDKGYQFDYVKVFDFCKKKNIDFQSQKDKSNVKIEKIVYEGIPCWFIANNNTKEYDFYILDGKNGAVLKEGKMPLPQKAPKNYRH